MVHDKIDTHAMQWNWSIHISANPTVVWGISVQDSARHPAFESRANSYGEKDPADSGSVAGTLHRGWIDIKAALATRDNHAVLAECERGEDVAVSAYSDALEETELSAEVRSVLQAQFTEVKAAHDRIRTLRDTAAA